jgi:probable F420-dependent oxidoreductase
MPKRPFRFGVQLTAEPGSDIRRTAREVEALGFDSLLVPDHLGQQLAPLPALAVLAEHTSRLRLGTLVLAQDLRNPTVLASEAATLDELSGGRFELGLGAGWLRSDYQRAGLPLRKAGERVTRLDAAITAIDAYFDSRPRPPLLVGGGGRSVLTVAGRRADIVGVNVPLPGGVLTRDIGVRATEEHFAQRVRWIAEAAGPRLDELELSVLVPMCKVTERAGEVRERLGLAIGVSPADAARCPLLLVGSAGELADELTARRDRLGISYVVVQWGAARSLAPVVERLRGT